MEGLPPGIDTFLMSLHTLVDRGVAEGRPQPSRGSSGTSGNGFSFQIRSGTGQSTNARSGSEGVGHTPTMSEFLRRSSNEPTSTPITGPLMAQYLMALLGQRDPTNSLFGSGDPATQGRMGDYVFNQEALDQIISQIMENSNTHRPVPATEEIVSNLPREVLEQNSPTLNKDCAICKDQFKLETEDPDEQVILTLPCNHPFHEPCILPWLKSSGTCPVCRHALVPQPDQHPARSGPESSSQGRRPSDPNSSRRSRSPPREGRDSTGILQSLFGGLVGRNNPSTSRHARSNSDPSSRSHNRGNGHVPGGWGDELD